MVMRDVIRIRAGRIEAAAAVALYGVYELVRGLGGENWTAARLHTADLVAFERSLGIFWEQGVQDASVSVPGLARILGVLYITLHFAVTIGFLAWVHRRRPEAFAIVRTTLVVATGLALAGYLAFPAAPPRLAGLGFTDTVSKSAGVNLSSDLLGALYNPVAAVPSLHFGYALLVERVSPSWLGAAGSGSRGRSTRPRCSTSSSRPATISSSTRRSAASSSWVPGSSPVRSRGPSSPAPSTRPRTPERRRQFAIRPGAPYGSSTSGTSPWRFSRIASRARSVTTVPFSVCGVSSPVSPRKRIPSRRAWKSVVFEHDVTSR